MARGRIYDKSGVGGPYKINKMRIRKIRSILANNIFNMPGWCTDRKIMVFESDDWGSIRMPSKEIYNKLIKKGIRIDKLSFNKYDSLASEDDLCSLFEVLISFHDKNGRHPVFTANCVVANPDFEKIHENKFEQYYYEVFTETLKRYPNHAESFRMWKDGINSGIFHPQFHGREHINVPRWMNSLRKNIGNVRLAFDFHMFDLSISGNTISENSFMDAFAFNDEKEFEFIKNSILEGLHIFEDLFGYPSSSCIAPCYIWDSKQEPILSDCGVSFIQGGYFQKCPIPGKLNQYKKIFHFTGQKNNVDQYYLVRNCSFEPSETGTAGLIEDCMRRITTAFNWNKPAIISTHRMNYIGHIVPDNSFRNLELLKQLLTKILNKFPDVEFMSSDQLGSLIAAGK
jgi:hypothetical protein